MRRGGQTTSPEFVQDHSSDGSWTVKSRNVVVRQESTPEGKWSQWTTDFRESKPKAAANIFRGYRFGRMASLFVCFAAGPDEPGEFVDQKKKSLVVVEGMTLPDTPNRYEIPIQFKNKGEMGEFAGGGTKGLIYTYDRSLPILSLSCNQEGNFFLIYWPLGNEGHDLSRYPRYFEGFVMA